MTKEKTGRPVGRPSEYDAVVVDEICGRIATGESLRAICLADDMPNESTFRKWVINDVNGLSAQYARARMLRADVLAEEVIDISDNEPDPAKARVRVDARKWYAGKVNKTYADKSTTELTGPGGGPVQQVNMTGEEFAKIARNVADEV